MMEIEPSDRPIKERKTKKKTVIEMLTSESICLSSINRETLLELVSKSQILEADRQIYLHLEIPRAEIIYIDMSKSHEILSSPKTLTFFLGPFQYEGENGTILALVESSVHKIHVVFLKREIIRTMKNENGIFSFQFGSQKQNLNIEKSAEFDDELNHQQASNPVEDTKKMTSPILSDQTERDFEGLNKSRIPIKSPRIFSKSTDNIRAVKIEKGVLTDLKSSKFQEVYPSKRRSEIAIDGKNEIELLTRSAENIHERTSPMNSLGLIPQKRVHSESEINRASTNLPRRSITSNQNGDLENQEQNLRNQIKSLQISLAETTKSIILADKIQKKQLISIYEKKIQCLQEENEELHKTISLLLIQNKMFREQYEPIKESNEEAVLSSPKDHFKGKRGGNDWKGTKFLCKWNRCNVLLDDKALLWRHVLKEHVRSQSENIT